LCWAWDFCRPPRRKEEGYPPHDTAAAAAGAGAGKPRTMSEMKWIPLRMAEGGGGGGAKPGTVGMCIAWDRLGHGVLLSILRLSPPPPLSLSALHSTPLLAETAPQLFRYDAKGRGGGGHQWNNLWFCCYPKYTQIWYHTKNLMTLWKRKRLSGNGNMFLLPLQFVSIVRESGNKNLFLFPETETGFVFLYSRVCC